MPLPRFKPKISACERPKTYALDRATTGTGTSAIMLSEKKKRKREVWSKKWYLKRNISCVAHLLNGLLEMDVPLR